MESTRKFTVSAAFKRAARKNIKKATAARMARRLAARMAKPLPAVMPSASRLNAEFDKVASNGSANYGTDVKIQIPVGRHETRSFSIPQAKKLYRHLHAIRGLLK